MNSSEHRSPIAYRPEIDGLRAVAIISVVVFHLWPDSLPGGYLGVDVFFVISGYLITSILIRETKDRTFRLTAFWMRRIRRLFPAFAVVTGLSVIFGYFTLFENEWTALSIQAIYALSCLSNIYFWKNSTDYWGEASERLPLLHTWSLSVEEQFYLLYPIAFSVCIRQFGVATTFRIATIVGLLSMIASAVAREAMPSAAFYLLPTRSWELLAGGVVAIGLSNRTLRPPSSIQAPLAISGLAAIVLALFLRTNSPSLSFILTVSVIAGTATLILVSNSSTPIVGPILSAPLFVFIGKISYSFYLWHWPVIVYGRMMGHSPNPLFLGVAVLLGIASYRLIEVTTRNLPPVLFAKASGACMCLLLACLITPFTLGRSGVPIQPPQFTDSVNLAPKYGLGYFGSSKGNFKTGLVLDHATNSERLDILLIGDSHSLMYFPAIQRVSESLGLEMGFYGADGGTSPFFVGDRDPRSYYVDGWTPDQRRDFDHYRRSFLSKRRPKIVVVSGNWASYFRNLGKDEMQTHLHELTSSSPDSVFLFLGQPPILPFGGTGFQSAYLEVPRLRSFKEDSAASNDRHNANSLVSSFCDLNNDCEFLSLENEFLSGSSINYRREDQLYYKDDDHLSVEGALQCVKPIELAVKSILNDVESKN